MTRRPNDRGGRDERGDSRGRDYTEFGFKEIGQADTLDRYLDGELSRESGAFRSEFVKRDFRERLAEMEELLGELQKPARGPDLIDAVLAAVDERRPFVASRTRRFVTVGRLAAAATVLLGIGVAVMVERARPGAMRLASEPEPLAAAVNGLSTASHSVRTVTGSVGADGARDAGRNEGREPARELARGEDGARQKTASAWLRQKLAPFSRVEDAEVRPCQVAVAAETGWAGRVGGWDRSGWDRGVWKTPDRTMDESAGLTTFPGLGGEARAWFATAR